MYLCYQGHWKRYSEESDEQTKMPWLWREQMGGQRWLIKRLYLRQLLYVVCTTLVLLYMCYLFLLAPRPVPADAFRASDVVETQWERKQLYSRVNPTMRQYMRVHPMTACIGAPNMRVYKQYVLLRMPDGSLRSLFNPRILLTPEPDLNDEIQMFEESDPMCASVTSSISMPRRLSVEVEYDTEHADDHTERLHITNVDAAVCLQHYRDVFRGHWPCNDTRHIHQPRYLDLYEQRDEL